MQYEELRYVPESDDPSITIETEALVVKVIDNTGLLAPPVPEESRRLGPAAYMSYRHQITPFTHHLGYHGIRTIYNKTEKRNLVVPFVSWLNLQRAVLAGIGPDPVDERAWAGMARGWPMRIEKKGGGAVLQLDPLPSMQMRYSLELQPAEPDGIDFSVRFELGRRPDSGPACLSVSWPCYTNAYDDVRLHYPRRVSHDEWEWASLGDKPDMIVGDPVGYEHAQESQHQEDQALPLAYGRIGDRALILMFSDPAVYPFVVNSGGHLAFSPVQNPAWDFGWTVDDYPLHTPIGFDGRLIYTRFESPERIPERYQEWVSGTERVQ